jgi:hypothetical protein
MERTLNGFLKAIQRSLSGACEQLINAIECLDDYIRTSTLRRLGATFLMIKKCCYIDEVTSIID